MRIVTAGLALATALAATLATAAPAAAATTVIAEIVAKPENADVIRNALTSVVPTARGERGCLSYSLFEDRSRPGRFLTYETWSDDASLDAHLNAPGMKQGMTTLGPLLASPPVITRLKPL